MTPHSVTGRLLSWLPARREGGPAGGVTIVIVIVSGRWSCIGREAGVSHKGEVESRWGLLHNYPRTPQYTSVHLVHLGTQLSSVHLVYLEHLVHLGTQLSHSLVHLVHHGTLAVPVHLGTKLSHTWPNTASAVSTPDISGVLRERALPYVAFAFEVCCPLSLM